MLRELKIDLRELSILWFFKFHEDQWGLHFVGIGNRWAVKFDGIETIGKYKCVYRLLFVSFLCMLQFSDQQNVMEARFFIIKRAWVRWKTSKTLLPFLLCSHIGQILIMDKLKKIFEFMGAFKLWKFKLIFELFVS